MKQLTLSIVIPVYNEEDYLEACLTRITAQTVKPRQVIVVDNNSTDRTVKIAKRFKFVTVLEEPLQGVTAARHTGFDAVTADIIGRIDADTRLPPTWVATVLEIFESKKVDAISGPTGWYDMPLSSINHLGDQMFKVPISKFSQKLHYLFGANMAVRRTAWRKVRSHLCDRQDIAEDQDLAIHLAQAGLSIKYEASMLVTVSARRLDDQPAHFYRYLWCLPRTYQVHRIHTLSPYFGIMGYSLGYFTMQWFRYTINPRTQQPTLKYLLFGNIYNQRHASRKDPMRYTRSTN